MVPTLLLENNNTADAVGIVWQTLDGMYVGLMQRLPFIAIGAIVFLLFLIIGRIIKKVVVTAGERTRLDITLARLLGRLAYAALAILGLLLAAVVVLPSFKPGDLVAGLGITSVAIGFAFKDVLQNFFAGILLLWRQPFVVGDEIVFGEFQGKVEDITVRSTRVKTYDGERAIIPNGVIYTSAVLVRTAYPQRRIRVVVGIGYSDDIEKARQTIRKVVDDNKDVIRDPGPWIYVSELAPSSVNFTVYFWVNSAQKEALRIGDEVVTGIKYALDRAGIDMPYPHSVVLYHDETGSRAGDIRRGDHLESLNDRDGKRRPA
jgi:small-conductance mechanosensitive channel